MDGPTYTIKQVGKRYNTIARLDGYWVAEWQSKNKKLAKRKGEEYVAGKRKIPKIIFKTEYGHYLDWVRTMHKRQQFLESLGL